MIITRHSCSEQLSPDGHLPPREREPNLGKTSRIVSASVGAAILVKGLVYLEDRPLRSIFRLAIGGYLLYRGISGYCGITEKLDDTVDKAENLAANTFA